MKKIFSLFLLFCIFFSNIVADDIPFRNQRREIFQLLPINEQSIVFLGNSITNFNVWHEAFGSDLRVVNRGISGITSGEWLKHIDLIVAGKPAKLFIMIGVNDFLAPSTTIPNVSRIIDVFKEESPNTQIYIQSILPTDRADRGELIEPWNDGLKQLCQEKNVQFIDLWSKMIISSTNHGLNPDYTTDNLHMNGSGYRVWTNDYEQYTGIAPSYAQTGGNQYITGYNTVENMVLSNYCLLPVNDGDVLMLGDYNVETGEWSELLRNPKVKNRGMGIGLGYTLTLQNLKKSIPYLVKSNAGKVFIMCGSKDLYNNVSYSTAAGYYQEVLTAIRTAAPNVEIYVQSIIPDASASVNNSKMIPFNNAIKALVDNDASGKIHFVDIYAQLAENGALAQKYVSANTSQSKGINGRAYLRWANTIAPLIDPMVAPAPEPTDTEFAMIQQIANARYLYRNSEVGEEIGQYDAEKFAKLLPAIQAAEAFLKAGYYTETLLAQEKDKLEAVCTEVEESRVGMPRFSTSTEQFWYTISCPLRNSLYVQSVGAGQGLMGTTTSTGEKIMWKFVKRDDNTLDIINRADESYIDPTSADCNAQLCTSVNRPSAGWQLSSADAQEYFIITSGTTQLNQTTSAHSYKIFNWGDGEERIDAGCQFQINFSSNEPTSPSLELTPVYTAVDLVLDGSAPIRVPDEYAQPLLAANEVSVVVDYTVSTVTQHMAFAVASDTTATGSFLACLLNSDTNGPGFGIRWGDGGECLTARDDNNPVAGVRRQVVMSMTNTTLRPYLNGTLLRDNINEGTTPWTMTFSEVNNANALYIGGFKTSNNGNKYPFTGTIHSIRFYTKALTAEEVALLTYDNLTPPTTESYAVNFETAENGTFEIRKGNEAITTGTQVLSGTTLTVVANPNDGYELDAITVNGDEISGTSFTVTGETTVVVTFKEREAVLEYCTYDGNSTHSERYLNSLSISGGESAFTISSIQGSIRLPIYHDKTANVFEVQAGSTVTASANWSGAWMHGYLYIDYDRNGEFSDNETSGTYAPFKGDRTGSELATFSAYQLSDESYVNSAGTTVGGDVGPSNLPAFTIPATTPTGNYRARYVVAWSSLDPCGYSDIKTHGGCIVDFTIKVIGDPNAVEGLESNSIQLYYADGMIYTNAVGKVQVYDMTGNLVKQSEFIPLDVAGLA